MKPILVLFMLAACSYAATLNVCGSPYNATGNGTTNDTAAVQSALTAAGNGDVVFWPTGCLTGIQGTSLSATGKTGITLRGSGKGSGIKATGTSSIAMGSTSGNTHIRLNTCTDCVVENMEMDMNNVGGAGLECNACTRATIRHNEIHHSASGQTSALLATSAGTDNVIAGNYIHHTAVAYDTRGMWIGNGGGVETRPYIHNNYVSNTGHSVIVGVGDGVTAVGNVASEGGSNAGSAAIKWVIGTQAATATSRFFNTIATNSDHGIQLGGQASNHNAPIIIKDLFMTSTKGDTNGDNGIYMSDSDILAGLTISQVECVNPASNCITILQGGGTNGISISDVKYTGTGRTDSIINIDIINADSTGPITINRFYGDVAQYAGLYMHTGNAGAVISAGTVVSNSTFRNMSGGGSTSWQIYQQTGTIGAGSVTNGSGNCWTNNYNGGTRNLEDLRGVLPNVLNSGSCPNPVRPKPAGQISAAL